MEQHGDIEKMVEYLSAQMEAHRAEGEPPGAFDRLVADPQPAVPPDEPNELPESNYTERCAARAAEDDADESRHRGGQPGNQNARKYGFYSDKLPPEALEKLDDAAECNGLWDEIDLLRIRIAAAATDPAQSAFFLSGLSLLSRLLKISREMNYYRKKEKSEDPTLALLKRLSPQGRLAFLDCLDAPDEVPESSFYHIPKEPATDT